MDDICRKPLDNKDFEHLARLEEEILFHKKGPDYVNLVQEFTKATSSMSEEDRHTVNKRALLELRDCPTLPRMDIIKPKK